MLVWCIENNSCQEERNQKQYHLSIYLQPSVYRWFKSQHWKQNQDRLFIQELLAHSFLQRPAIKHCFILTLKSFVWTFVIIHFKLNMCVTEQLHGPDGQRGICVFNEFYFHDSYHCSYWSVTSSSLRNISVYTINPDDLNNLEITINIYGYLDNNIFIGTLFWTLASFVTFTYSSIWNSLSLTAFWTFEFTSNNEL